MKGRTYYRNARWVPRRSRRIVKKLLRRAVQHPDWSIDAVIADGKRIVTFHEIMAHGLQWRWRP